MPRWTQVDLDSPDPTAAINAFLWNMNKARALGFLPSSENMMAEHFFRNDVKLMFYSSAGGIISLAANEDALDADDTFEILEFALERLKARKLAQRQKVAVAVGEIARTLEEGAAQRIETRSDETPQAVQPEGREPGSEGMRPKHPGIHL